MNNCKFGRQDTQQVKIHKMTQKYLNPYQGILLDFVQSPLFLTLFMNPNYDQKKDTATAGKQPRNTNPPDLA